MADTNTPQPPASAPALPRTVLRRELGGSGTLNTQGFISGEEYNRNLIGRQALQNYDIMSRSDATVHAALQVCKLPILAAHWKFKPASDDPADVERADLLNREFFDRKIDFYDVMSEGLTCLDFGYAALEIVYELMTFNNKQFWGLAKLASRKQNSILRWQTSTGQPGITQILFAPPAGKEPNVDIPMQKLAIFTNEKRGDNYEGISLLRFAYKHWYLKDKLELMNAVALDQFAHLICGFAHRDTKRLGHRRTRDDIAIIVAGDDHRAILPVGPKDLLTRGVEVIAVGQGKARGGVHSTSAGGYGACVGIWWMA